MVNKRVQNAVIGCNLKNNRMISIYFQGKPFNITVIQVYAQPLIWRSWSWRPTRPSRTKTQNRYPFHFRGLECKSRKSGNIWSNRQIWSWNTEWNRAKANRVLPREPTGHNKHFLPTTQKMTLHMDITRWSTPKPGPQPCLTQWNYKPCHVGPPKTDGSWWIILTKCGTLEKGMASHISIFLTWECHAPCKRAKR